MVIMIVNVACNNNTSPSNPAHSDSTVTDTQKPDTAGVGKKTANSDDEEVSPDAIDSSFILNGENCKLHFKHYCLMDSIIKVPKKYLEPYGMDLFVTHNFASAVKVEKNSMVVVDTILYKKSFQKYLDDNLKSCGVLLYPTVNTSDGTIEINYSISIPLTDIGVAVGMNIDKKGKLTFKPQ